MALLAQLPHEPPALDLRKSWEVLHLFQCITAGCSSWSYDDGCNAAFILPRETLGEGLTQPPKATKQRPTHAWVQGVSSEEYSMHGELWITGWHKYEDTIPEHMSSAYCDLSAFYELPEKLQVPHDFDYRLRTKAGGVPYWTANGPGGFPELPRIHFEYLLQIDTFLFLQGQLPDPTLIGCDVQLCYPTSQIETRCVPKAAKRENAPWSVRQDAGRDDGYVVEFANFGSDGTAYVFIDHQASPPKVLLYCNR